MANFKIVGVGEDKKYHDDNSYRDVLKYIFNHLKTEGRYYGGIAINPNYAVIQMETLAYYCGQLKGSRLRHMVLSFNAGEIEDPMHANALAWEIASFYGDRYQIVWAVHTNTDYIHIHFVMNKVCYLNGRKYRGDKKDYYDFQRHMRNILASLGIDLHVIKDVEE